MSKWTREEEIQMLKELSGGKSMQEIATIHNRSVSGMELRLKKIIYDNVTSNKSEGALAKMLNMPEDTVKQYYYEYKGFLEKKNPQLASQPLTQQSVQPILTQPIQTKPIIQPLLKPIAPQNAGGQSLVLATKTQSQLKPVKQIKPQNGGTTTLEQKLTKVEMENKLMHEIIENIQLKRKMKRLENDSNVDYKLKRTIRKLIQ